MEAALDRKKVVGNYISKLSLSWIVSLEKSVTFPYIHHWKSRFQRRVVLENDFVRFRSRDLKD